RVSYNGGNGGIEARPNAEQVAAMRGHHIAATNVQVQHQDAARDDRTQWASVNHGRPTVAATPKPGAFRQPGVVAARNAPVNTPATAAHPATAPNQPNPNAERRNNNNNVPRPPEHENNAATPHTNNPPAANNRAPEATPRAVP